MSAVRSGSNLTVIPLRHTNLTELEALFDQQCEEWLSLLRWDYSGPSRLIREVARARELPGFSASNSGGMIGFGYYTVEAEKCSIGDVYMSSRWRDAGADRVIIVAMLDEIAEMREVTRIESQCVSVGNRAADLAYRSRGFIRYDRVYMMLDLKSNVPRARKPKAGTDAGISFRSWRGEDFSQAARVICRSYNGEQDSLINSQYSTEEGCGALLSILTSHIWCGDFLPEVSRVAVGPSGNVAAVLIATRVAPFICHFAQISVHPAHQNRGIGRMLIAEAAAECGRLGYDEVSLAVTASNKPAHHLYESCGFRTVHEFPVYCREGLEFGV
ncbi:MAG TPA: GNAT family N-acetyltransferase [Blastocatellia bacterium]|nr:GNAT family N-acetyltransferase [Blastocatellia bacterium]